MARVLVTDGEERTALAVVRSVGRAGHEVRVISSRGRGIAGWSRWTSSWTEAPSAMESPSAFVRHVRGEVAEWTPDVVLPVTEGAMEALLPYRDALGPVRLPFPGIEPFRRAAAKTEVAERARQVGIRVPRQRILEVPECLPEDVGDLDFPVAVKAARSLADCGGERVKTWTMYADRPADLPAVVEEFPSGSYPLLVQERITGPGIGIFLLLWEGEVRARFAHRRIREKPPSGGVSVLRESVEVPESWFERGKELLRSLGWCGVGMVELKLDASTGEPYVIEVNPRFWGSLQLAVDAGVDFPALLVALALGREVPSQLRYRIGVRTRWFWGDVDHLLARLRRSAAELDLPPDGPGRMAAGADFVRGFSPAVRNEVLRWSDPLPAVAETLTWFRGR